MKPTRLVLIALYILSVSCSKKPKAPEPLPGAEVQAFKEAIIKLAPYVALQDSAYSLMISKSDAAKMGVPEKYYHRMSQELEYTNYLVREEYNGKGIPIGMPVFRVDTTSRK